MTGNEHIENLGQDLLAPVVNVKPTDLPDLGNMDERERQCRIQALQIASSTFFFDAGIDTLDKVDGFIGAARAVHAFIHEPVGAGDASRAHVAGPGAASEASQPSQGPDGA